MKYVYIVYEKWPDEDWIMGIYSSREEAQKCVDAVPDTRWLEGFPVTEAYDMGDDEDRWCDEREYDEEGE